MNKQSMFRLEDGKNVVVTFTLVCTLFLLWGFCNGMIDIMDKHFQNELHLTLAESAWVQFAHYLGYFIMALPAGWLAVKLGYKGGIIVGLAMVSLGGFWFIPATKIAAFWAFLLGVCIIAAGLTFLETIANPYTTVLGHPRYAATRINLAQTCNGIGWVFGPIVGGMYFYGKDAAGHSTGNATLWIPYAAIAVVVLLLIVVFFFASVPDIKSRDEFELDEHAASHSGSIWSRPHFVMAVLAQFLYVGAQAGIFSFFINYLTSQAPEISDSWSATTLGGLFEPRAAGGLQISDQGAATLSSIAFLCFLTGRFIGAGLLRRFAAHKVLGLYGLLNVAICLLVFTKLGWLSVACVFLSYFFMSIMFPTIFALGIYGLGMQAKKASAFIVMAIMGGAALPKLMGFIADKYDISRGFIIPAVGFLAVGCYGIAWKKLSLENIVTK